MAASRLLNLGGGRGQGRQTASQTRGKEGGRAGGEVIAPKAVAASRCAVSLGRDGFEDFHVAAASAGRGTVGGGGASAAR